MAEAIARFQALEGSLSLGGGDLLFVSAGTSASDGDRISREALDSLQRLGIDHSGRSKRLTAKMVRGADFVFGMTAHHVNAARSLVAGERDQMAKIRALDDDEDVQDPIGMGQTAYDRLAKNLVELIPRRISEMLQA